MSLDRDAAVHQRGNEPRPGSIAPTIVAFPGAPRVDAVLLRDCASAGFVEGENCNTVAGGLDIGSIDTGATPGTLQPGIGGGLDGIPDIQFSQLSIPDSSTAQQYNARVDYQVTENDLVAFSMYFVPNDRTFNDAWEIEGVPASTSPRARRNMVGTLLWTRTLSDTAINEARFNVTRWYFDEVASNPDIGWGIPQARVFFQQFIPFGNLVGPGVFSQNTFNFRDTLTKVVGAHALKFGVDVIREQNNDKAPWAGRPEFSFDNLWSFANDAPNDASRDRRSGDRRFRGHSGIRPCRLLRRVRAGRLEGPAEPDRQSWPAVGILLAT